jgi:ABC-type transport system involved in cytochrome c biogenesis permease subunit
MDGPTIHPSLLWPLLVMAIGFTLLFFFMHMVAMRTEIWRRRVSLSARLRQGCQRDPLGAHRFESAVADPAAA